MESATISITSGFGSGEDVLSFVNAGSITGSYNAVSGVLTLTGSASKANYETALESIKYHNTNTDNPNTGNRTVTWLVNDGSTPIPLPLPPRSLLPGRTIPQRLPMRAVRFPSQKAIRPRLSMAR